MADPVPAKQKRSKAKTAGIILGIVIGVAVAGYLFIGLGVFAVQMAKVQQEIQIPSQVFVSGQVETVGFASRPVSVIFIDESTGDRISGGVNGHNYDVVLPNGNHNWRVSVGWEGSLGASGSCSASGLSYSNTMDNYRSLNLRC
jgi:hypothetical protein